MHYVIAALNDYNGNEKLWLSVQLSSLTDHKEETACFATVILIDDRQENEVSDHQTSDTLAITWYEFTVNDQQERCTKSTANLRGTTPTVWYGRSEWGVHWRHEWNQTARYQTWQLFVPWWDSRPVQIKQTHGRHIAAKILGKGSSNCTERFDRKHKHPTSTSDNPTTEVTFCPCPCIFNSNYDRRIPALKSFDSCISWQETTWPTVNSRVCARSQSKIKNIKKHWWAGKN